MTRLLTLLVAGGVAAAVASGCGSGAGAGEPAPSPLVAQALGGGAIPRVTAADLKRPIARYRAHVARQLGAMQGDVERLSAASSAGDLEAAKSAWLEADARYQAIGAAYGAFGDLDAAIDGLAGGLPGGVRSASFTGLHRIELALWARGSTSEAADYSRRLAADVARLRAKLPGVRIEPLDYALRAHEVLEDSLHLELSGDASPWAGAALVALRSNIEGTKVVLGTLRPLIRRRNPQRLAEIDRALARLSSAVRAIGRRDGSLPRWDALSLRRRELIYGLTAAAAEQLAYVPEIADPRAPLPRQPAIGQEARG